MSTVYDIHALHPSKDLPASPSSELKNAFKSVFQKMSQSGPVSITRNRKREAILLPADLYDQIINELASKDPLELLRQDYETCFADMQSDASAAAYEDAFSASPAALGDAAKAHQAD
ncbi:MAG TPA: hypothetical protein DEA90_12530 [Opitutae bacterium]|nr:hypothetical protein [Puniceicoccaceae bacterium]HBR94978.1 hypothetical protein [Opitutae bacterium]|tara:strand:- start:218 stop:568 length:351 start_codon:yes stop_codon:yes gene_type:complete